MKILDVPQCGKRGVTVSQGGRYGQVSRALVIPTNPRTPAQMMARNVLAGVAAQWRGLTQAKRDAWTAAAKSENSKPSDGQSGTLTGAQLFTKINVSLNTIGAAAVTDPPEKPAVSILPVTGLTATWASNVLTLALATTDAVPDGSMLRVAAPVSQGRSRPAGYIYASTLPSPVNNVVDITNAYTAKFGVPPIGKKVFVMVNQNAGGWQDIPHIFSVIIPAKSS